MADEGVDHGPSRAHKALLASTHHPLLQPPHSELQTQLLQHTHNHPAYGLGHRLYWYAYLPCIWCEPTYHCVSRGNYYQ